MQQSEWRVSVMKMSITTQLLAVIGGLVIASAMYGMSIDSKTPSDRSIKQTDSRPPLYHFFQAAKTKDFLQFQYALRNGVDVNARSDASKTTRSDASETIWRVLFTDFSDCSRGIERIGDIETIVGHLLEKRVKLSRLDKNFIDRQIDQWLRDQELSEANKNLLQDLKKDIAEAFNEQQKKEKEACDAAYTKENAAKQAASLINKDESVFQWVLEEQDEISIALFVREVEKNVQDLTVDRTFRDYMDLMGFRVARAIIKEQALDKIRRLQEVRDEFVYLQEIINQKYEEQEKENVIGQELLNKELINAANSKDDCVEGIKKALSKGAHPAYSHEVKCSCGCKTSYTKTVLGVFLLQFQQEGACIDQWQLKAKNAVARVEDIMKILVVLGKKGFKISDDEYKALEQVCSALPWLSANRFRLQRLINEYRKDCSAAGQNAATLSSGQYSLCSWLQPSYIFSALGIMALIGLAIYMQRDATSADMHLEDMSDEMMAAESSSDVIFGLAGDSV